MSVDRTPAALTAPERDALAIFARHLHERDPRYEWEPITTEVGRAAGAPDATASEDQAPASRRATRRAPDRDETIDVIAWTFAEADGYKYGRCASIDRYRETARRAVAATIEADHAA